MVQEQADHEKWIQAADMEQLSKIISLVLCRYEQIDPDCEAALLLLPQGPDREEILKNTVDLFMWHSKWNSKPGNKK